MILANIEQRNDEKLRPKGGLKVKVAWNWLKRLKMDWGDE